MSNARDEGKIKYSFWDEREIGHLIEVEIRELDLPGIRCYSEWMRDAVRKRLADGFGDIDSVYGISGGNIAALMAKTREVNARRALANEITTAKIGASPLDIEYLNKLLTGN